MAIGTRTIALRSATPGSTGIAATASDTSITGANSNCASLYVFDRPETSSRLLDRSTAAGAYRKSSSNAAPTGMTSFKPAGAAITSSCIHRTMFAMLRTLVAKATARIERFFAVTISIRLAAVVNRVSSVPRSFSPASASVATIEPPVSIIITMIAVRMRPRNSPEV